MSDVWQIISKGETYDGDFEALKLVAAKGIIQPTDQVRCNDGEWMEAQQIAELSAIFHQRAAQIPTPAPTVQPVGSPQPGHIAQAAVPTRGLAVLPPVSYAPHVVAAAMNGICQLHPELDPTYLCTTCGTVFCRQCAKTVGVPAVGVCESCNELCHPFRDTRERIRRWLDQRTPFGLTDLRLALAASWGDLFTLGLAAVIYSVSQIWDAWMAVFFPYLVILGLLLGNLFLYVCMGQIIRRLAGGSTDTGRLVDISVMLENPAQAFLPAVGSLIIGPGMFLSIVIAAIFYNLRNLAELSPMPIEWLRFWGGIGLGWGLFYYPIALLVGGYSESFRAAINPILGLDTARRMGFTFIKLYLFYLSGAALLGLLAWVIIKNYSVGLGFLLAVLIFWVHLVLAGLIGRAIFKASEKLHILD